MKKLRAIVAIGAFVASVSFAQEVEDYVPMTLKAFTDQLLSQNNPDAVVMGAEVFGMSADGAPFYAEIGAASTTFASAAVVLVPTARCKFPPLDSAWEGSYWYVWCKANNASFPNYEAQRDKYYSINGQPPVYASSKFYDCQNAQDKAAMTSRVRASVC
jgi:hypothetical protein